MADEHSNEFQEIISRLKVLQQATGADKAPPVIPLIDPTANVRSLVAAAMERQDDLRASEFKRIDESLTREVRCGHEVAAVQLQAQKDLAAAESKRIDAITLAESRRIDALLAAATNAVALASEKAGAQAATLAQQVATSAEALRAQVATTSTATTTLITQLRESLEKRLTLVEQNQYQTGGATMQRTEGRQRNEWVIGLVIGLLVAISNLIAHFWK